MQLSEAFGLGRREIVALVGAGGKTATLYRLADELAAAGRRVIATTTTHMCPPPAEAGWPLVIDEDAAARLPAVARALAEHGRVLVAARMLADGKLQGAASGEVEGLAAKADFVLVEADGARGRWLKAPAEHEPVIPPTATLVVPIVGLGSVGQPLAAETVHRPERLAALLHVPEGSLLSPEMLASLLVHERGGLRGAPPGARVVPFCNQADDEERRALGRYVATRVLRAEARIGQVVVGAAQRPALACERWVRSAVIVLAAGAARRYGRLKQAEDWQGQPFLVRAVEAALSSLATEVIVVLGCRAEQLAPLLAPQRSSRLRLVTNTAWVEGMASSMRAGLRAVDESMEVAVFCHADQPLLSSREIDALLIRHAATAAPVVVSRVQGEVRPPVLFARPLFAELALFTGDAGGRSVAARYQDQTEYVEAIDPLPYTDVDTTADYRRLAGAIDEWVAKHDDTA